MPNAPAVSPAPGRKPKPDPIAKRAKNIKPRMLLAANAALGAVVGPAPLPRAKLLKALWAYIKKNNLRKGTVITADAKLLPLLGGQAQINMYDLHKLVSAHWTEQPGKSPLSTAGLPLPGANESVSAAI